MVTFRGGARSQAESPTPPVYLCTSHLMHRGSLNLQGQPTLYISSYTWSFWMSASPKKFHLHYNPPDLFLHQLWGSWCTNTLLQCGWSQTTAWVSRAMQTPSQPASRALWRGPHSQHRMDSCQSPAGSRMLPEESRGKRFTEHQHSLP